MIDSLANSEAARDTFVAELTTVALELAGRSGVRGPSVDLEIDLWRELGTVVEGWRTRRGRAFTWDDRLAQLTDAAYRVMLKYHFAGPFVDLEMSLWRTLRQVIRRDRFLPTAVARRGKAPGTGDARLHLSGVLAIA